MKADITRHTFDPARHYSSVRLQQGRVQLDADLNEQADLSRYRDETTTADVVGACGGPLGAAAFGIVLDLAALPTEERDRLTAAGYTLEPGDFVLTPGRYYVDGILCELEHAVPFTRQPDRPPVPALDVGKAWTISLDVWQRHITALDDALLREVALGGPDTATRTRTVWQVRAAEAAAGATCADAATALPAASTGRLAARARREAATPDPCLIPATAGYTGLENQLYRVEIHGGGALSTPIAASDGTPVTLELPDKLRWTDASASFAVGQAVEVFRSNAADPMEGWAAIVLAVDAGAKRLTVDAALPQPADTDAFRVRKADVTYAWSRDNGSVVSLVSSVSGRDVVVASLGPDELLRFAPGQWAELVDDAAELEGRPGFLSRVAQVDTDARTVTLAGTPPALGGGIAKLRRWDGVGAAKLGAAGDGFAELENGVQVRFAAGTLITGDHWMIPARTATADARSGTVEWPQDGAQPALRPPAGIVHHRCPLAVLTPNAETFAVEDCRDVFPPLTDFTTLAYVGGDGQEARPGIPLPQPLEAAVFRGEHPVAGATVTFETADGGTLAQDRTALPGPGASFTATTDATGIARCYWLLDADTSKPSQQVEARLRASGGAAVAAPVHFDARHSLAREVAYEPGECAALEGAATVQEALDVLCKRPSGGRECCRVIEPGESIEEAIREAIKQKQRHVCLCLRPGAHAMKRTELAGDELASLTLQSCGGGARLRIPALHALRLEALTLRSLVVDLMTDAPIAVSACGTLTVESSRIRRVEKSGPVLTIADTGRVRIHDSMLDAGAAIAPEHPVAALDGILLEREPFEYAQAARRLARRLAGLALDERAQLGKELGDAAAHLSMPERIAYAVLVDAIGGEDVEEDRVVGALASLRDAARFAVRQPALVLADASAEALITGTDLLGMLQVGGADEPRALDGEELAHIAEVIKQDAPVPLQGVGALHVRDVRVTGLTVAGSLLDRLRGLGDGKQAIPMHRLVHLADTEVVSEAWIRLVAVEATLTGVDLTAPAPILAFVPPPPFVVAFTAVVTACRGRPNIGIALVAHDSAVGLNVLLAVNVV